MIATLKKKRFKKMKLRQKFLIISWLFILPILLIRGLTTIYPVFTMLYYSLLEYDLMNRIREFNWFHNYPTIFRDVTVQQSIRFTLEFTFISTFFIAVLGIALALLLKCEYRGRKLIRTTVLIPWGLPMIIVAMAGRWIFNDSFSIINDMIRQLFYSEFHYPWLADPTGAKMAAYITNIWKGTPFFAIIMLAAFQGIPSELSESARVDGASSLRILVSIMLPYVKRTIIMLVIFVGITQIHSFDIAFALTRGGPGSTTTLMAYRLFLFAMRGMQFGLASALSVLMFAFTAIFGVVGLYIYNKVDY